MSQPKIAPVSPIQAAQRAPEETRELSEEQRKRLEELRQARIKREESEAKEAEIRELEAEELTAKLEGELGRRGEAFEIVNNRFGLFAVRKPDTQAIRAWERATDQNKGSLEWQIAALRAYVLPQERGLLWAQLAGERPGLCWQTAEAFVDLMGIDRSKLEKKR